MSYVSFYWSTTTYPYATRAYFLGFTNTVVNPSDYTTRYIGFSVPGTTPTTALRPTVLQSFSLQRTALSLLYFIRGGYTDLNVGSLRRAGFYSFYWSATTYPNAIYAYHLGFAATSLLPSNYDHRVYGFSINCFSHNNTTTTSLYFVRGGNVHLKTGSLRRAGDDGNYWPSTTYSNATQAYSLTFFSTNVYLSDYTVRYDGFSVRNKAFVRGGYIVLHTGSLKGASNDGIYWSATTYPNATYVYDLDFGNTNAVPSDYNYRHYGFSVR